MKQFGKRLVKKTPDASTEEKIKEAARKVFTQKGYKDTRTRDIAHEAGINLALLNYYFRSKEKLFDLIMLENLETFMMGVHLIAHDEETTWQAKVEQLVNYYIEMLLVNPDIPLFVITAIKNNPDKFSGMISQRVGFLNSPFMKQVQQDIEKGIVIQIHPLQLVSNIMGLVIFPFIANSIIRSLGKLNQKQFMELMNERKKLLPRWIIEMVLVK